MISQEEKKPFHVFIIPDGNRRWAENQGLVKWAGHQKGQEVFRSIIREIWLLGVTHLTVWGLSKDNFVSRPKMEIFILMEIFEKTFDELLSSKEVEKEKLRVRVIGRWKEFFSKELIEKILRLENKTRDYNSDKNLTLLLAYNGDEELADAVTHMHLFEPVGKRILLKNIRNWLWTRFLPDVDIMIRTGYEPHLSGAALSLQMANAHLYFPQMHWPDFTIEELKRIIDDFKNREHRFGA